MANIKESAKAFVPKTTKNVADLDKVDLEWPVEDRTGTDSEGKEFVAQCACGNKVLLKPKVLQKKPDTKAIDIRLLW